MNELVEHAKEARRQAIDLRRELSRLTQRTAETRLEHVERREICVEAVMRSRQIRDRVPSWPAWSGPTPDLRSTLVPLE